MKGRRCVDAAFETIDGIEQTLVRTLGPRRLRELQRGLQQILDRWPEER